MTKPLLKLLAVTLVLAITLVLSSCGRQSVVPQQGDPQNSTSRVAAPETARVQIYTVPLFAAKELNGLNMYSFTALVGKPIQVNENVIVIAEVKGVTMTTPEGTVVPLKQVTEGPMTFGTFRTDALNEENIAELKAMHNLNDAQVAELKRNGEQLIKLDLLPAKVMTAGKMVFEISFVLTDGRDGKFTWNVDLQKDVSYDANL